MLKVPSGSCAHARLARLSYSISVVANGMTPTNVPAPVAVLITNSSPALELPNNTSGVAMAEYAAAAETSTAITHAVDFRFMANVPEP